MAYLTLKAGKHGDQSQQYIFLNEEGNFLKTVLGLGLISK